MNGEQIRTILILNISCYSLFWSFLFSVSKIEIDQVWYHNPSVLYCIYFFEYISSNNMFKKLLSAFQGKQYYLQNSWFISFGKKLEEML